MMQYQNPYMGTFTGQPYQQYPQSQVVRVNGENGARAYQMAPNSSILLLDESAPIVWLKTTDGAGYPTVTPYSISPVQTKEEAAATQYSSLEERVKRLEEQINAKSDAASIKSTGNHGEPVSA